jgi:hypothetical protein
MHDVVAKPGVLLDVGQHHRPRRLSIDEPAIAREQARLVDEQAVLPAFVDEAIQASGKHGAVLAHIPRTEPRE